MQKGWNEEIGAYDLSLEASRIVHDQRNQNVKTLIMGATGRGKSYTALGYAYGSSVHLSYMDYKEPDRWEDYLNIDENMAIANRDKLFKIMKRDMKPCEVIIADEIQMMANSRDFKESANRIVNMFFQLMRTNRNILIGTIQEQFVQDKQSRSLYTHYIDMGKLDAFEIGINFCKVFRSHLYPRTPWNPVHYVYPREAGKIVNLLSTGMPPQKIVKKYDKIRDAEMKRLRDEKMAELEKEMEVKRLKEEKIINVAKDGTILDAAVDVILQHPDLSIAEQAEIAGCGETTIKKARVRVKKQNANINRGGAAAT